MCIPEIARAITSRWISDVPSKIIIPLILSLSKDASRCQRSTSSS